MASKTKAIDYEATRAELRGEVTKTEAALEKASGRIGELVLDCRIGAAPESALEEARGAQAALEATLRELGAALEAVDEREAEAVAAAAEKERRANEKRLSELRGVCDAVGAKVVDVAGELAAALDEGRRAAKEATALCRRLGVSDAAMRDWPHLAGSVANAVIHPVNSNFSWGGVRPGELEKAKLRLAGREA